jgi:hypothetical protein
MFYFCSLAAGCHSRLPYLHQTRSRCNASGSPWLSPAGSEFLRTVLSWRFAWGEGNQGVGSNPRGVCKLGVSWASELARAKSAPASRRPTVACIARISFCIHGPNLALLGAAKDPSDRRCAAEKQASRWIRTLSPSARRFRCAQHAEPGEKAHPGFIQAATGLRRLASGVMPRALSF